LAVHIFYVKASSAKLRSDARKDFVATTDSPRGHNTIPLRSNWNPNNARPAAPQLAVDGNTADVTVHHLLVDIRISSRGYDAKTQPTESTAAAKL